VTQFDLCSRGTPEPVAKDGIDQQRSKPLDQSRGIAYRDHEPRHAFEDVLSRSPGIRHDDSCSARHGFEDDVAGGLELRGVHEHVGSGEVVRDVLAGHVAFETDA